MFDVGTADLILIFGVACHATFLAYIHTPRWKAFFYALPVPFTLATIALGNPVNASHVLGLPLAFLFAHLVRVLYDHLHVPIIIAIACSGIVYCLLGGTISQLLPHTDLSFWGMLGGVFILGGLLQWRLQQRHEAGHRSPLPIYQKFIIIVCVITGLVALKDFLQGTMAFFPMVGVVAAYEARFSLWTWSRQIPILMVGMTGLLTVCRLLQPLIGLIAGLLCGWMVFLVLVSALTRRMWSRAIPSTTKDAHAQDQYS